MPKNKIEPTTPKENSWYPNPWMLSGLVLIVGFGIVYVASQSSWLLLIATALISWVTGFFFGWAAKETIG